MPGYSMKIHPLGLDSDELEEVLTCGMSEGSQTNCLKCCGLLGFLSFIAFLVGMSSYVFLQPDDQVLIERGDSREVLNGPQYTQFNPFSGRKTWRKATLLNTLQYARVRHRRTMEYRYLYGPQLLFLGADDQLIQVGNLTILQVDEYIRLSDRRTGRERVERGPGRVVIGTMENSTKGVEKAVLLDHDTAVVIQDRTSGTLLLETTCSHGAGPYIPAAGRYVVEERPRLHVLPHELLVVRDENSRTHIYGNGTGPTSAAEGRCDGPSGSSAGEEERGVSFFLPPYSKILRMQWSNYSVPPDPSDPALRLTSLGGASVASSLRRRRTSRSAIVKRQAFKTRPTTWLVPGDFDPVARVWSNRGSGLANLTNVVRSGVVRVTAESGGGTGASLLALTGTTGTSLSFGYVLSRSYTICSLTRYTGSSKQRILTGGGTTTWYHGHWRGLAGVARYGSAVVTQTYRDAVVPDTEWVPMCGKSYGSIPGNVLVGKSAVGVRSGGTPPPRLEVNTGSEKSSFAIGELIIWNTALSDAEMQDAMDYLMRRLMDAKTYVDQLGSSVHSGPKRMLSRIDLRLQKSFYKYQVRTNDNVRLMVEGTVFWRISDVRRMLQVTADPEGDVWSRSRSMVLAAISNVTFGTFTSRYGDVIEQALSANSGDGFLHGRGVVLDGIELTKFEPMDNHTQAILRRIIRQTTQRTIDLERQLSRNEIRREKLAADIQLEGMRTRLIQTRALNTRLEAEKAGATEGTGLANVVRGYLSSLRGTFASVAEQLAMLRFYWTVEASKRDVFFLFNGNASAFLLRRRGNGTKMVLQMPDTSDL